MRENGFITEEEYEHSMKYIMERKKPKASGDPHPGSSTEAAAAVAMPPVGPRRKLDREDEAWVKANALPKVLGCTITHDVDGHKQRWYAKYLNGGSRSRRSRAYGDKGHKGFANVPRVFEPCAPLDMVPAYKRNERRVSVGLHS